VRFGIDGFAASLISCPRGVRCHAGRRILARGETLCGLELDDGPLELAVPVAGQLACGNPALDDDPAAIIKDPYGDGWIADLVPADEVELPRLMSAEPASEEAYLDLRRFRRRIALQLLADDSDNPLSVLDHGQRLADARRMLGAAAYLQLVREFVH
jgi:glycine cleavage system H protein